jgi:hypothetical protein
MSFLLGANKEVKIYDQLSNAEEILLIFKTFALNGNNEQN